MQCSVDKFTDACNGLATNVNATEMWYQYGCMFSTRIISTYDHLLHQAIATYMEKRKEGRGLMMDRNISRKLKGKVLDSCVVPASTYGLDRLALSELHQHKLQVC